MSKEVMQQALEALEEIHGIDTETECVTIDVEDVINVIKEALKQDKFEQWWRNEGSAPPNGKDDYEEHCKKMCAIAWANGAAHGIKE